jgi:hypothetical protein
MKGRVIIILLLLIVFALHGQASALIFSGGIPERVKKRGLRVSCWVICSDDHDLQKKVESDLNKWIEMYLRERLKDLKLVDEKKVTDEVLKTVPHLTIGFEEMNRVMKVETELSGYDVIIEGISGRYIFWRSFNNRLGYCSFYEFRELVRPILDEFIYQYLTGTPKNPK